MSAGSPLLRLLVLRTPNLDRLRAFYEALGLAFAEEQHGTGPVHLSATVGGVVLELYPAGEAAPEMSRLGFTVADLTGTLAELERIGTPVIATARETEWGQRAVVRDPDGRAVELYQDARAS